MACRADDSGNIYDDGTQPPCNQSTPLEIPGTTYVDASGASVADSGSGSSLSSILQSVAGLGTSIATAATLGPQNKYAPYGYGPTGVPLTQPASATSSTQMIALLAVLGLAGFFLYRFIK